MIGTNKQPPHELDLVQIREVQNGVPHACRHFVKTYQKVVFAVLWRMLEPVGKGVLVEDLAQEVFLRAFRALPNFDTAGSAKLSTWLLTIATRLALNELRKKVHETGPMSHHASLVSESQADEQIRQREMAKAIDWALSQLSSDFRAVFLLSKYHELNHQEIAQVLNVRVGTVKSRLSRATQQMKALFTRYYDGDL